MQILGIDTVLNSSSAAVLGNKNRVLSNIVKTKKEKSFSNLLSLSDFHIDNLGSVINEALKKANTNIKHISLLAVSNASSMRSSVTVGVITGNIIAQMFNIPIIGVDHIKAHIFSNWVERNPNNFNFPILVLSSSGANSCFALIEDALKVKMISQVEIGAKNKKNNVNFLGIGSLFSYLANNLYLSQNIGCGSLITKYSKNGNSDQFILKSPKNRKTADLNFSWLKDEITKLLKKEFYKNERGKIIYSKKFISDICASFEKSISKILFKDIVFLAKKYKAKEIHLVGGISQNINLQKYLNNFIGELKLKFRYPIKPEYSNDNAAMVASRGHYQYIQNPKKYLKQRKINVISDLKLEKIAIDNIFNFNK